MLVSLGFGLTRVLGAVLPRDWFLALGRACLRAGLARAPRLREALLDNAAHLLGPGADERARFDLALEVLASFMRFTVEMLAPPAPRPLREDEMVGREHWERAAAAGRGIVMTTLHMGNYELGAALLARLGREVALVYTPDPTGVFERARGRRRRADRVREIAIGRSPLFAIEVLAVLRRRGIVLLAGDLGFEADARAGAEVLPFLGGRAPFLALPARAAVASGAPVLPCFIVRDRPGRYRLEMAAPIFPDGGKEDIMKRLVSVFEEYVRRYREQWLVIHRYWTDDDHESTKSRN